jgi:hypothetical protein
MKKQVLLPHKCKWIGLGILLLGVCTFFFAGFLEKHLIFDISDIPFFTWTICGDNNFLGGNLDFSYTLQIFLIVAGGLMFMFSKEKIEDEFTMSIRLKSLMWSVLANYIIVLMTDILLYGKNFLFVMTYNFYTVIVLYVVIFNFLIFKNSRKEADGEK